MKKLTPKKVADRSENKLRLLKRLRRGEREVRNGEGFDLSRVLLEADKLLRR
jgi:hypothetical protein